MLIVAGYLQIAHGSGGDYLAIATRATRLARDAPGCLDFVQAADPLIADRIVIYERWESEADLLAFRDSDPDEPDEPAMPLPEILGAEVARYEISTIGPA